MAVRFANFSVEGPVMSGCLFCDKPGNLVEDPDEEAYHAIKNVADERQDATRDKFYFLYNDSWSRQCFSWHVKCATAYVCFNDNRRKRKAKKTVPKQEMKSEVKQEIKTEVKQEIETEVKQEIETEVQQEIETEIQQEIQTEVKQEIKEETEIEIEEDPHSQRKSIDIPAEVVRCLICNEELDVVLSKAYSLKARLSAAKLIFEAAHTKHDGVFIKIRQFRSPKDMIDKGIHYHKACYFDYVGHLTKGRPTTRAAEIPRMNMYKGLKRLLEDIDDKLPTTTFQLSFLAKRLAKLTEVKDAYIEEDTVKSYLISKYGDQLLFSYPDGLDSCVVFRSSVPLSEAMKRLNEEKEKSPEHA